MFWSPPDSVSLSMCSHEYSMSYQYHAMSNYFNRDNVGLPGFAAFFRASSLEERNHAQQLMDFQVQKYSHVHILRASITNSQ